MYFLDYKIELVVMRNIPQNSDYKEPLFQWLQEVIIRACTVRRDVRVSSNSIKIKNKLIEIHIAQSSWKNGTDWLKYGSPACPHFRLG